MGDNPEIAKQEEDKKKNGKRESKRVFNPDSPYGFRNCFLIVGRRSKEEIEESKNIKRLRDLMWVKIEEAEHKKRMIEEIAGFNHHHFDNWNVNDYFEKEFDPIEYDNNMNKLFGDDYYNADDHIHSKPEYDDDELAGLPVNIKDKTVVQYELGSDGNSTNSRNSEIVEALRKDLEDKYEALAGNLETPFKYRKVKPDRSKLSAALILWLDEPELKQYIKKKKRKFAKKPKNRT